MRRRLRSRTIAWLPLLGFLAVAVALACAGEDRRDAAAPSPATEGRHSALWGKDGEAWSASGRLPDFSHAGYGGGAPIPEVPVAADVTDFGAVGDGVTDDSEAFLTALASMDKGALLIPPGRYRLTRVLELDRSGLVLRGAGPGETVLFFPRPLFDALGKGPFGGPFGWAWGGGWIWARGELPEEPELAEITRPARRGDYSLAVSTTDGLEPGRLVRLSQREIDGSLTLHLHNDQPLGGRCWIDRPGFRVIDWAVQISHIERGRVYFDRPLRVDVRPDWSAALLPYHPTVSEVGVEGLTIEFPPTEYNGHHDEPGYNAIYFEHVHDSWVRDVAIRDFDTAVSFWGARYATASGLRLYGRGGHYGLNLGASQDCVMTDFTIENVSEHDLSVSNLANGNVFSNGRGRDVNFDHHRGAAYENLFSNIDVGASWRRGRLWDSSGTPSGHYTAARETFWNIRPRVSTKWIPAWPQITIVGPVREKEAVTEPLDDLWLEPLNRLEPPELHAAQRRRAAAAEGLDG